MTQLGELKTVESVNDLVNTYTAVSQQMSVKDSRMYNLAAQNKNQIQAYKKQVQQSKSGKADLHSTGRFTEVLHQIVLYALWPRLHGAS